MNGDITTTSVPNTAWFLNPISYSIEQIAIIKPEGLINVIFDKVFEGGEITDHPYFIELLTMFSTKKDLSYVNLRKIVDVLLSIENVSNQSYAIIAANVLKHKQANSINIMQLIISYKHSNYLNMLILGLISNSNVNSITVRELFIYFTENDFIRYAVLLMRHQNATLEMFNLALQRKYDCRIYIEAIKLIPVDEPLFDKYLITLHPSHRIAAAENLNATDELVAKALGISI